MMYRYVIFKVIGLLLLFALVAGAFERVKFAVISDPHISLPALGVVDGFKLGTKTVELLQAAISEINSLPDLDFVLVLGDLTQDAEPWNVDTVKLLLDQLKVPYYVILGNHDVTLVPTEAKPNVTIGVSRWTWVSAFQGERGGFYMDGRSYYSREVAPGFLLVAFDTTGWGQFYGWGGQIFPDQLSWLKTTLAANQDKFVIVAAHHNFVFWHPDEEAGVKNWNWFAINNASELRQIFEQYNVKLVLTGHRHISTRYQEVNGVYYFVNPSICTYPMRWTLYELTPTSLSWEVHDVRVSEEIWKLAKENFLKDTWWRPSDCPPGPEGDAKYLEFYEGAAFLAGEVTF
ncbi:MAG: metallophosphoesterase family protein [Candidatus Bipolaricaulaceae bacterium]